MIEKIFPYVIGLAVGVSIWLLPNWCTLVFFVIMSITAIIIIESQITDMCLCIKLLKEQVEALKKKLDGFEDD
jgi:hypothetical protein